MAYINMAYIGMAYIGMAYIIMARIVMDCVVMAVTALPCRNERGRTHRPLPDVVVASGSDPQGRRVGAALARPSYLCSGSALDRLCIGIANGSSAVRLCPR